MRVEVLRVVKRLPLRIDAMAPAAVRGVLEIPQQRREQPLGMRRGGRAVGTGKHIQLARARHGAIALRGQRRAMGVERLARQAQACVEAALEPERHDDGIEMLAQLRHESRQISVERGG
ncbi:Uncharacterised protein [Bordetella pertussis]|nr:Uncharacterised protein [Bordetella pertussis]